MSHVNARLTVRGRALLVARVVEQGWPVAHAAAAMGISRQCAHRWVRRYREQGQAGLVERSSRPARCPGRTPAATEERVLAIRRQQRWGPSPISRATGVPARTVTRILARHQMPRLAQLDPMSGEVIRASKQTSTRYERSRPGELIHMDVKKIGRIPDGGGWRAHGRAATQAAKQRRVGVGYEFVHAVVDDHTRFAYAEVLPDETAQTCAAFLRRAADHLAAAGIRRIERVMTDNALAYRNSHAVAAVMAELGAKHKLIRPHCPWQNGKVERFNRTLATEWAYAHVYTSNTDRTQALAGWLQHYNNTRGHTALAGQPPATRVSPTS